MKLSEKIAGSLAKTRGRLASVLRQLGGSADTMEKLEEMLLLSDVGPEATSQLMEEVRKSPQPGLEALRIAQVNLLAQAKPVELNGLVMLVGINGSGKTTTLAKLAHLLQSAGKAVFVVGADTFRAAADTQLEEWCQRIEVPHLLGRAGADPASVIFDGLQTTAARRADVVLCDTAGRVQSNVNLMRELAKMVRVGERAWGTPPLVLMVLDAATGQNAVEQVRIFKEAVNPHALIVTKLDGSARGGIVISLSQQYGLPVQYLGIGEGIADLVPFEPELYVRSLLPEEE